MTHPVDQLLDALTVTRDDLARCLGCTPQTVSHKRARRGRNSWTEADAAALVELARARQAAIDAAVRLVERAQDADGA